MAATAAQNRVERKPESQPGTRAAAQTACDMPASIFSDLQCYTRDYVHRQPEKAALICLGVGFILGWKLKPW